ncbi:hypothetical protein LRY65_01585 [Candidatus Woesebacteria bacterium]|nr:hypothetical protein [Candidatus Woesebacteria bacterium]MCD8507424.1 hypothetical protein [Candidatus Woesebacteria bacterium]MCD8526884.1 hypothetical protein [Candidatus Woesebacteria bacterium]MCD8545778.1 hypothetical protein [Candidatus Woesebacteria bacterium]
MKENIYRPDPMQPWPEATPIFNCFQNGMIALLVTLDKRSRQPNLEVPRLWVVDLPTPGEHTYLVWKGKVYNRGTTGAEGSPFTIGSDLELPELQRQGMDKTSDLLQELIIALEGGDTGLHNFRSIVSYIGIDKDRLLVLAEEAIQQL